MTIPEQTAMSFKPFIDRGCTGHMEIVKDMEKSIKSAYKPLTDWVLYGQFLHNGLTYTKGVNDFSALTILKEIYGLK